jgi:peptidoglycan/xylan/chitin deacetylase (PgdA/CDA1 family)
MRLRLLSLVALACVAALAGCSSTSSSSSSHPASRAQAHPFQALAVPPNAPARSVRVPILTYHRVHDWATELTKSVPDLTVQPDEFAAHIAALAERGYHAITQRQLFEALYRGDPLPPKPVLISVDDGYVDDVTQILPVLQREHMVATFYVVTGRMHEQGFLDAAQIRELDAAGMDVGAHTRHHVALPQLGPAELDGEVAGSRRDLEQVLGHPVYWFAYPFGELDASVVDAVRRAGFLLAATTRAGARESTLAPLEMPRIHVGRATTVAAVLAYASGAGSAAPTGGE